MPPFFYKRALIDLGDGPRQHGHVVYPCATYQEEHGDKVRIIYKKNKQNKPELSRFEVAFGELARLFLSPELTPQSMLVKDEKQGIVGVASEHITYTIARHAEGISSPFYKLVAPKGIWQLTEVSVKKTADIPFYFLDQCPPGFFKHLTDVAKRGQLSLDMASIATVLAGSYALEEDDLHKGNLGFYVVQKNNKPHVVFFKIDHDLMLADSVMSRWQTRFFNWFHGSGAFEVTKRDLVNFPRLQDSQNYYWPTLKHSFLSGSRKAYTTNSETQAFVDLANSPEFCNYKWLAFYKHVLIPPALIQQTLAKHLDLADPLERERIALITQSVVVRQAKLRAVLFAIPAFRDFVKSLDNEAKEGLVRTIMDKSAPAEAAGLSAEITASMERHQGLCQPGGGFVAGDTPLHAAIRLQDYRYYDTWQSLGHYAEQTNKNGEKPLDVAVKLAGASSPAASDDVRADVIRTMKHMLRHGARPTAAYKKYEQDNHKGHLNLNDYLLNTPYSDLARQAEDLNALKVVLRDLGEDYRYSLKMQKELAVVCVRQFIRHHQENEQLRPMLKALKADINGTRTAPPAMELQFIRQLRSQLWIVRIFRGLLGGTTTQVQLNRLIDKQLTPTKQPCCGFFSRSRSWQKEDHPPAPVIQPKR